MNTVLIKVMLVMSLAFFGVFIIRAAMTFLRFLKRIIFGNSGAEGVRYRSFRSKLLIASFLLIFAVWCLRFAVGYYAVYNEVEGVSSLKPSEAIFNSLVHTLQTISLDEDYTVYITAGKSMISEVIGSNSGWIGFYGVYAAVLNILVPVICGAILVELLSEFSPKLRLFWANICFRTEKFYFSELNNNSITLAKSILDYSGRNINIIFTDAYADTDEENSTELMAKARTVGAICVKDDLLHIDIHGRHSKIFLIDSDENSNIQALTALLDSDSEKVKGAEIYVFSSDSIYSHLDEETAFVVNKKMMILGREYDKLYGGSDEDKKNEYILRNIPAVIPINGVRNMVTNQFSDLPLFEPLIGKEPDSDGNRDLNVTILGSGVIGTEVFLTAYWCGQMLGCRLNITVVSKERRNKESSFSGEGDFEGRINYINPDIFKTADPGTGILNFSDSERSEPYFSFNYKESDVMSDDFVEMIERSELLDTDYFVVALGSDEENFAVADRLRQIVGKHHLFSSVPGRTVISYVVYNSDLARALNKENKHYYSSDSKTADIIMCAFGSLESVYSVKNIFFEGKSGSASEVEDRYNRKKNGTDDETAEDNKKKRIKNLKDIYSYYSSLAKVAHRKYREFSVGFHKVSLFETDDPAKDCNQVPESEYLRFIVCAKKDEQTDGKKKSRWLDELAWLEHRRWCAYMRVKGFRVPESEGRSFKDYYSYSLPEHKAGDHKFIVLKLHPCLVECGKAGIHGEFDEYGFLLKEKPFSESEANDFLDEFTLTRKKLNPDSEDAKKWDYPEFELSGKELEEYKKER